jgi:hypothetical protein
MPKLSAPRFGSPKRRGRITPLKWGDAGAGRGPLSISKGDGRCGTSRASRPSLFSGKDQVTPKVKAFQSVAAGPAGRATPSLDVVAKETLCQIASLEERLRAREEPEKRPLALAKGLQKLKRAAYHAHKAPARASRPLETELLRISASIALRGLDAELAGDILLTVGAAVVVEAETGEPVARRIATAVDWFEKPHAPTKPPRHARYCRAPPSRGCPPNPAASCRCSWTRHRATR